MRERVKAMGNELIYRILQNPDEVYEEMLYNNEEFRRFVEENKSKSTEQLIREYDIHV